MALRPRPISRDEFIRMFRLCRPLSLWPDTIAIGNSGGPDSTCLLFLINRYLTENSHVPNLPRRVVSLHVNHGLQAASDTMAQRCTESAKSIGVEHHVFKVPWSQEDFPQLPTEGPLEHSARIARFRVLFQGMTKTKSSVLALGHHADDQVETALMRIMKGSTEDGAAGMKSCRRWGMDFGHWGHGGLMDYEGMRRWIVRPFLRIHKDRILATCDENKLEYVTDETNHQPDLTLRNAIRHWLQSDGKQSETDAHRLNVSILRKKLDDMNLNIDLSAGVGQIYTTVNHLALQAEDIDHEVDFVISRNALRAPAGTYLMTQRSLAAIENPKVQRGLILRILRYASFHPWGSLAAQVKRRSSSITQITDKLWNSNPFDENIRPFCAGGGVMWNPVAIVGDRFRFVTQNDRNASSDMDLKSKESFGWLASRQAPASHRIMSDRGISNPLRVNLTPLFTSKLTSRDKSIFEFLYDSRFLVTVNLAAFPTTLKETLLDPNRGATVWAMPHTRWFWPKLVLRVDGKDDVILHSTVQQSPKNNLLFPNLDPSQADNWKQIHWRPFGEEVTAPWIINVDFMRPLTTV